MTAANTKSDANEIVQPSAGPQNIPNNQKTVDTSYKKYLFQGYLWLILLVVVLGGWSAIAKIKGAVIASGRIIVESKPKTLQHLDGGIVGEILVQDGVLVNAGDVVLRLDPTEMDASRTIVSKRLNIAQARFDRLRAERDSLNQITWSPGLIAQESDLEVRDVMVGQNKLFQARRRSINGQIGQLRERIAQSSEQISGFEDLIGSKRDQLALISQELDGLRQLLIKGYVSKTRVLALEREEARLNGEIATHRSDIARTRSLISETEIQMLQLRKDSEASILTETREVESELNDLREQLTTASGKRKQIDITTPVTGIVHDLVVTTIGGVITPGQSLMQIIPVDDRLIIESRVLPNDIDQVYNGQVATVRMSAFNQRTTSELKGLVIKSSADSLVDEVTGMPYFSVLIEVPEEELKKLGDLVLVPGMPAEAFIQTEDRRVISYLMKPFTDQLSRAFREE